MGAACLSHKSEQIQHFTFAGAQRCGFLKEAKAA
jgi:hypothetical protein